MDNSLIEILQAINSSLETLSNDRISTFWTNPGTIALITFLLGLLGTGITYQISQYRKRCSLRLTIISWLEANKSSISRYATNLQKLYMDIESSDDIAPPQYGSNHISVEKISEFTIRELNDALVQNLSGQENKSNKSKKLFHLLRNIEFIGEIQDYIKEYYNDYVSKSTQDIEKWEAGMRNFNLFMATMSPNGLPDSDVALLRKVQKIGIEFHNQPRNDSGYAKLSSIEKFLTDLQNVLMETKATGAIQERLLMILYSIIPSYRAMKDNKESYTIFKQLYEKLNGPENHVGDSDANDKSVVQNIEDCLSFYEKRKIKFIAM